MNFPASRAAARSRHFSRGPRRGSGASGGERGADLLALLHPELDVARFGFICSWFAISTYLLIPPRELGHAIAARLLDCPPLAIIIGRAPWIIAPLRCAPADRPRVRQWLYPARRSAAVAGTTDA